LRVASVEDYVYNRAQRALDEIPPGERNDIYVVSFFIADEEGDPSRPTLTIGFNTESDVAAAADETDEMEARWNYAFYRQNELVALFGEDDDPRGAVVRREAIDEAGYSFPGDDATTREVTTLWFVSNIVFAARRLHDSGEISRIFGESIPVLVHELEYHDTIAMQNMAANPPGVADDFIRWCRNL
jgi:hypothetical protein